MNTTINFLNKFLEDTISELKEPPIILFGSSKEYDIDREYQYLQQKRVLTAKQYCKLLYLRKKIIAKYCKDFKKKEPKS